MDFNTLVQVFQEIPILTQEQSSDLELLMLGCGDSSLAEMIYQQMNLENITNIDFSEVVIDQMEQKTNSEAFKNMDFMCIDVT